MNCTYSSNKLLKHKNDADFSHLTEAVALRCSQISQQGLRAATLLKKETPRLVFSCEICKNFKNIYFHKTRLVQTSSNKTNSVNTKFPSFLSFRFEYKDPDRKL